MRHLIQHYADGLKQQTGLPLPRTTATHLAKVINQLRIDGVNDKAIQRGLDVLLSKGLTPGALPGAVIEAATRTDSFRGDEQCPICHLAFKTTQRLSDHLSNVHHVDAPTAGVQSAKG